MYTDVLLVCFLGLFIPLHVWSLLCYLMTVVLALCLFFIPLSTKTSTSQLAPLPYCGLELLSWNRLQLSAVLCALAPQSLSSKMSLREMGGGALLTVSLGLRSSQLLLEQCSGLHRCPYFRAQLWGKLSSGHKLCLIPGFSGSDLAEDWPELLSPGHLLNGQLPS